MEPTAADSTVAEISEPFRSEPFRLALSVGEPAGIGPDLAVLAAQRARDVEIVAFADPELLAQRAHLLGLPLRLEAYNPSLPAQAVQPGRLICAPVPLAKTATAGQLDPVNAHPLLAALNQAWASCMNDDCAAMVTAPLQKSVINDAGIAFSGHTEYLAELAGGLTPVMLLAAGHLRVALVTTHLPLSAVAAAITPERLRHSLEVLRHGLIEDFGLSEPRILVLGLNPHAGESGHLGREEIDTISPLLETLRAEGYRLEGPLPADTAFVPKHLARADAVLAMYHDQGLPVLKHAGFGQAVNVTLGLPIVRTSVDHGTALDLAGTGRVDPGSLEAALNLAADIAARRQQKNH